MYVFYVLVLMMILRWRADGNRKWTKLQKEFQKLRSCNEVLPFSLVLSLVYLRTFTVITNPQLKFKVQVCRKWGHELLRNWSIPFLICSAGEVHAQWLTVQLRGKFIWLVKCSPWCLLWLLVVTEIGKRKDLRKKYWLYITLKYSSRMSVVRILINL